MPRMVAMLASDNPTDAACERAACLVVQEDGQVPETHAARRRAHQTLQDGGKVGLRGHDGGDLRGAAQVGGMHGKVARLAACGLTQRRAVRDLHDEAAGQRQYLQFARLHATRPRVEHAQAAVDPSVGAMERDAAVGADAERARGRPCGEGGIGQGILHDERAQGVREHGGAIAVAQGHGGPRHQAHAGAVEHALKVQALTLHARHEDHAGVEGCRQ